MNHSTDHQPRDRQGRFGVQPREEPDLLLSSPNETGPAAISLLRARIAEAIDNGDWGAVAPLVDRLAETGWEPACPECGTPMGWERDMADADEQWLWCGHCEYSYESDQFETLKP